MGEFSNYASLVYPAAWPTDMGPKIPDDAHCTLFALGEIDLLNYNLNDVLNALRDIDFDIHTRADIVGLERFGPTGEVPVWLLGNPFLQQRRAQTEAALNAVGIENGSVYKEYRPHVSVPEDIWLGPPSFVFLEPAQVWWGDEHVSLA